MRSLMSSLLLVALMASTTLAGFRQDRKCGPDNLDSEGQPANCLDIEPFPTCCQINGHCGWDCDHVSKETSKESTKPVERPEASFTSNGKYRSDGKCGAGNFLDDGVTEAECDPNSDYWCCSEHGFCGGTPEHCNCDLCKNYRPVAILNKVRSDRRCGPDFPLPDDQGPAECNPEDPERPCCSKWGFCGPGPDHCDCVGCTRYDTGKPKENALVNGRVRGDRRCGSQFPLSDGKPGECDPTSANPCCSQWGFCGPGADHCDCPTCKDYRTDEQKAAEDFSDGLVRPDRRCGKDFLHPVTKEMAECDPESEKPCCSKWGYCGGDADHCACPECVDYSKKNQK